jgi:hypothetical protein
MQQDLKWTWTNITHASKHHDDPIPLKHIWIHLYILKLEAESPLPLWSTDFEHTTSKLLEQTTNQDI